jgi:protein-L-isoaspartate(D-aspartate) O-methyltransferase
MNYEAARHNMVENQLRANRVTDPQVIQALEDVPREVFVPNRLRGVAYRDEDIDLGGGRYLMEPMVFARLLQAAGITSQDVVLDVGCGTGYSAAVLARLASTVVALEADTELAGQATSTLAGLSVDNVAVVAGPLTEGDAAHGPYNVIILEGSVAKIPEKLLQQLAEGGRLVAVATGESGVGRATVVARLGGLFSSRVEFDAAIGPLPGFRVQPGFVL